MSIQDEVNSLLRDAFGVDFRVRADQSEAIVELIDGGKRVILVQRTGWGKSAVYFAATRILRDRGRGPTIIISPLLALMRDQIENAKKLGVKAVTFNHNNVEEWSNVHVQISNGEVDAILISPERFNNEEFRRNILIGENLLNEAGLIVVDEAHCISDWGHDFRPDYRRIKGIAASLPESTPILLTTATANKRVVDDIQSQVGNNLVIFRGTLDRESLRLSSLGKMSQAERLAWLTKNLPQMAGTGIIYCLTVRDVELVSDWLNHSGIKALGYSGDLDAEDRIQIEEALKSNSVKAVVATSALGMGYDKPDLSFVIHFQMPSSPVAYYQQVGRAGRNISEALGVLMCGYEDDEIWEYFLRTSLPVESQAREVLDFIMEASLGTEDGWVSPELVYAKVNMTSGRVESLLKLLDVEGFLEYARVNTYRNKPMVRLTAKKYVFDAERISRVHDQRIREQEEMNSYLGSRECRMAQLRRSLDDVGILNCKRCDNCTGIKFGIEPTLDETLQAEQYVSTKTFIIEPRKQFPNRRQIAPQLRNQVGLSISYLGQAGVGSLVLRDKRAQQSVDERLVKAAKKAISDWSVFDSLKWITYVPSLNSERPYTKLLAEALSKALDLPLIHCVVKVRETDSQKLQENSYRQYGNVLGAYRVEGRLPDGNVLLVDDIVDSRWTLTVIGQLLRENGSGAVYPFTLARQKGS